MPAAYSFGLEGGLEEPGQIATTQCGRCPGVLLKIACSQVLTSGFAEACAAFAGVILIPLPRPAKAFRINQRARALKIAPACLICYHKD